MSPLGPGRAALGASCLALTVVGPSAGPALPQPRSATATPPAYDARGSVADPGRPAPYRPAAAAPRSEPDAPPTVVLTTVAATSGGTRTLHARDRSVPLVALSAYRRAAEVIASAAPDCGLRWNLLAAIGRVESDHGRSGGAALGAEGTSRPAIRGVALDGKGPVARIPDTDGGLLDGDDRWDRAVGPMQFLPATWSVVAVDGDADGIRSPDDLDDAALAAGVYLCGSGRDLRTAAGLRSALLAYNRSPAYVSTVLAVARGYRDADALVPLGAAKPVAFRAFVARPDPPARPSRTGHGTAKDRGEKEDRPGRSMPGPRKGEGHGPAAATSDPPAMPDDVVDAPGTPDAPVVPDPVVVPVVPPSAGATPEVLGSAPASTPDPPAVPEEGPDETAVDEAVPEAAEEAAEQETADQETDDLVTLTGVLEPCDNAFCLAGVHLDVGTADALTATAGADLDLDGVVETRQEELDGLVGTEVELAARRVEDGWVVVTVDDRPYATTAVETAETGLTADP